MSNPEGEQQSYTIPVTEQCPENRVNDGKAFVGKIISRKILNRNGVRSILQKAWESYSNLKIPDHGENLFLITVDNAEDAEDITKRAPWNFGVDEGGQP